MHKYWFAHSANKRKLSSLILGGVTENASENASDIKTCQTGAWLREIYIYLYISIYIYIKSQLQPSFLTSQLRLIHKRFLISTTTKDARNRTLTSSPFSTIYASVALLFFLVTFRFLRPNTTNEHQDLTRSTPKTKNKNQILNVCVWFNSQ